MTGWYKHAVHMWPCCYTVTNTSWCFLYWLRWEDGTNRLCTCVLFSNVECFYQILTSHNSNAIWTSLSKVWYSCYKIYIMFCLGHCLVEATTKRVKTWTHPKSWSDILFQSVSEQPCLKIPNNRLCAISHRCLRTYISLVNYHWW